jgi:DMSO reductase family type II enzyme heme b subunit
MRQRISLTKICFSIVISAAFIIAFIGRVDAKEGKMEKTPEIVEKGKRVYEVKCMSCHGEKGDGKGAAAPFLFPPPRDFTMGLYKIKSALTGELPTEEDLFNVITRGMPGTSMPGWDDISPENRWGLVYYIETFSEKFARAKEEGKYPPPAIEVGAPIPPTPDSIKIGKEIFLKLGCETCHGEAGRGDWMEGLELTTEWGDIILPRDLSRRWTFRRDSAPQDIYRTVRIGVEGTPMPSFAKDIDELGKEEGGFKEMKGEERTWHLVNYVLSLSPAERPEVRAVYNVKRIEGPLPDAPDDKLWNEAPMNEYPLGGQIIVKPRMFTPRIDFVQLKALYNQDEIAFLLTWHDPSKKTLPDTENGFTADAAALQLPQEIPAGTRRPYFLNGDPENPVYLLHWSADRDGITEMNATGMDRVKTQDDGEQDAKGAISYDSGEYRLLIKRPLKTNNQKDLQFEPGKFIPIAFSAWEGGNGETEAKRSISAWYFLILEAQIPKKIYGYPLLAVFAVAVVEAFIIRRIRRNQKG